MEEISNQATNEGTIQQDLQAMRGAWEQLTVVVTFDGEDLIIENLPELQVVAVYVSSQASCLKSQPLVPA